MTSDKRLRLCAVILILLLLKIGTGSSNPFQVERERNFPVSNMIHLPEADHQSLVELLKSAMKVFDKSELRVGDYGQLLNFPDEILAKLKSLFNDSSSLTSKFFNYPKFHLPRNLSSNCHHHLSVLIDTQPNDQNLLRKFNKLSSMQMLDAMGKPPSGFMMGNMFWLGDFRECLNVKFLNELTRDNLTEVTDAVGEYCLVRLYPNGFKPQQIDYEDAPVINLVDHISIKWGVCFPNSCSTTDKEILLNYHMKKLDLEVSIEKTLCQTAEKKPMDFIATFVTWLLMIPLMLVGLGTACDWWNSKVVPAILHSQKQDSSQNRNTCHSFCYVFSARLSLKHITSSPPITDGKDNFNCVYAIRFFISIGVILVHVGLGLVITLPWKNQLFAVKFIKHPAVNLLNHVYLYLNTFMFLSGFFLSYNVFTKLKKHLVPFEPFIIYIQRYIRISAPYLYIIGIVAGPLAYISKGPLWPAIEFLPNGCRKHWWQQLLYTRNIVGKIEPEKCAIGMWYLSVDMHLFIIAVLLVGLLLKKPTKGVLCIIIVCISSILMLGFMIAENNFQLYFSVASIVYNGNAKERFFGAYERKFWYRMCNCGFGILFGYILSEHRSKIKPTRLFSVCGWTSSALCFAMIVGVSGAYEDGEEMPNCLQVLYATFGNIIWFMGCTWIIIHCIFNPNGKVNRFLNWKWFVWLGKLSYSMYLVHGTVLVWVAFSTSEQLVVSPLNLLWYATTVILYCIFFAFALFLVVESPIDRFIKLYFTPRFNKR